MGSDPDTLDAAGSPAPLRMVLVGHLTPDALQQELSRIESQLRGDDPAILVVDCTRMKGYEAGARSLFTEWNAAHRHQIRKVAIAVSNPLWHMVIATMSLLSAQTMRPFSTVEAAIAWAREH